MHFIQVILLLLLNTCRATKPGFANLLFKAFCLNIAAIFIDWYRLLEAGAKKAIAKELIF